MPITAAVEEISPPKTAKYSCPAIKMQVGHSLKETICTIEITLMTFMVQFNYVLIILSSSNEE